MLVFRRLYRKGRESKWPFPGRYPELEHNIILPVEKEYLLWCEEIHLLIYLTRETLRIFLTDCLSQNLCHICQTLRLFDPFPSCSPPTFTTNAPFSPSAAAAVVISAQYTLFHPPVE